MASETGTSGLHDVEHNSPDLLKNTPFNILRLAHEIEQCEGRQKYIAQTGSPSDGCDVRWYFCKVPLGVNEYSASVPKTEIVGRGDYFRFGMRDSLAIEASFLQREDELLSSWWKEFAESSDGPKGDPSSSSNTSSALPSQGHGSWQVFADDEERVGVPVKGGLYEVDLVKRHCFPVYWNGENRRVLRGHWFALKGGLDWFPLREDVSEQLEYAYHAKVIWHRRTFQPSGLFAARVDLQGSVPGIHALFTGEDDTWEAWLCMKSSGFSGFSRDSIKLRRGYAPPQSNKPSQDELRQQKEEEIDDYCSQVPVRHLVFMIHGIGQRLEKSNLVDDVGDFRHITASLSERHLTAYQRRKQRILYIPCQWRKGLTLSGESAIENITLDGVRGLRRTLSATVHDVLYYMSPIYCQEIIDSVSNQLNMLYLKFLKRNPGYDGNVSIYGHSLGSVLSYDILCHQETLCSPFPMEWLYKEGKGGSVDSTENNQSPPDLKSISDSKTEDHSESNRFCPTASSESGESTCTDTSLPDENHGISSKLEEPSGSNDISGEDDRDGAIRSLKEEIDMLRAKIREYEAQSAGSGICRKGKVRPGKEESTKNYTPLMRYTKLVFKVDTFYAVGSPLGVFLSMRNVRIGVGRGKEYWGEEIISEEMPACRQMLNIFHPCDPVAYRLEPLVCKENLQKRPVIVPYHRGGKRLYVGYQEFRDGLASHSRALMNHLTTARVKVLTICTSTSGTNKEGEEGDEEEVEERSYGSYMMERLTGSLHGRIDHTLQDKTFRHPYLSVLSSHTNYWRDPDTALFILNHLYRDIADGPDSFDGGSWDDDDDDDDDDEDEEGGEGRRRSKWRDPREVEEEELPLTFADTVTVKNFTFRAKK
ncbi:hypothetical protein M569_11618, partial [Genlisea aurea]